MWCHFVTGPCHVVVSSLHDVTLIWRHSYFIIHHSFLDLAGFFSGCGRQHWYTQCLLGVCTIFIICFLQLLLFENHVCCENLGMTARLRVAWSVPVLTAVVTVISDFPASSIFHSILQLTSAILWTDSFYIKPWLSPSFFDRRFCWDRSSHPGSRWAAVDCGAVSTSGQALQLRILSTDFFCPVTCQLICVSAKLIF